MKKGMFLLAMLVVAATTQAQYTDEDEQGGFKKENLFLGGAIGLGIGGWNGGFNIGANPEVGYSIAQWLDAGVSTNINYYSFRAAVNNGIRQRTINYGGGVFTRIWPIRQFFVQALPEYNWLNTNLKDMRPGSTGETFKLSQQAPSMLLGVGYGSRNVGGSNFFTVIMFDVGNNSNSPYIDSEGAKLPILRTGFNIYLGPKRRR